MNVGWGRRIWSTENDSQALTIDFFISFFCFLLWFCLKAQTIQTVDKYPSGQMAKIKTKLCISSRGFKKTDHYK